MLFRGPALTTPTKWRKTATTRGWGRFGGHSATWRLREYSVEDAFALPWQLFGNALVCSGVPQWFARWAYATKARGSKPRSTILAVVLSARAWVTELPPFRAKTQSGVVWGLARGCFSPAPPLPGWPPRCLFGLARGLRQAPAAEENAQHAR